MYTLKKSLGQHFLKDETVCIRIVEALNAHQYSQLLEVGPGGGALTKYLKGLVGVDLKLVEIDAEKVAFLLKAYPHVRGKIIEADILDIDAPFSGRFTLIGNFPYNISSQIVFKVLEERHQIPLFGGMFQKEVAERLCAPPGNKTYGILSVLCQAYFDLTYDFTVPPSVFNPPPKVESGVMHMVRKPTDPDISFALLKRGVKAAFGQRRKTLRNALKVLNLPVGFDHPYLTKRAEQLGHAEFVELLNAIEDGRA